MAKLLRITLLIFLFLFFATSGVLADSNLPELVEKTEPAVVFIKTYDQSGRMIGLGSGFFISPDGELATNRHVLRGAYSASVETIDGHKYWISRITGLSVNLDLVRVIINNPPEYVPFLEIETNPPRKAEPIIVFGNPQGFKFTVSEGIISAFQDTEQGKMIQFSAAASPGSSGGPLINMRGRVVGVTTSQVTSGQNLNFALPAILLLSLNLPHHVSIDKLEETINQVRPNNVPQTQQVPKEKPIIRADKTHFDINTGLYVLTGNVFISARGKTITADSMNINIASLEMWGSGNIFFKTNNMVVSCNKIYRNGQQDISIMIQNVATILDGMEIQSEYLSWNHREHILTFSGNVSMRKDNRIRKYDRLIYDLKTKEFI